MLNNVRLIIVLLDIIHSWFVWPGLLISTFIREVVRSGANVLLTKGK